MGQAAGPLSSIVAAGFSLASTGFTAEGDILKGKSAELQAQGVSAADTFKAEELERAAEYGDLKAVQTSAQMTRNLNVTLGNIDAIRAAAHTDPTSPTGAAYRDMVEEVGGEQKGITVESILAQSQEDVANAAYLRQASGRALLAGDIGQVSAGIAATADILKGISGALGGGAGGGAGGGGGSSSDVTLAPGGLY
jgi:hypothetical protein